jgi:hypothetical protein
VFTLSNAHGGHLNPHDGRTIEARATTSSECEFDSVDENLILIQSSSFEFISVIVCCRLDDGRWMLQKLAKMATFTTLPTRPDTGQTPSIQHTALQS